MDEDVFRDDGLYERVSSKIVGRRRELKAILAALAAGKNLLLEGPPGTTKSTILRAIAEEVNLPFYMVEGNADLTPQKLIGNFNPAKVMAEGFKKEFFEPGPLTLAMEKGGLLYIEEFNRMPEDVANVLIRAMEERELVIPRYGIVRAGPTFRVICSQNPYDDVGTTKVSRAIMDRFARLKLSYQSREEEVEIVKLKTGSKDEWLIELAVDLARATRLHPSVKMGASVRGAIDMVLIAKELERMNGGLSFEDLYDAAVLGMSSKIWLKDPRTSVEELIRELLTKLLEERRSPSGPRGDFFREGDEEGEELGEPTVSNVVTIAYRNPLSLLPLIRRDPSYVLKLVGGQGGLRDADALEVYGRLMDYLNPELKDKVKEYASNLIIKLAESNVKGGKLKKLRRGPLNSSSLEIDIDATIDRVLENPPLSPDKVVALNRTGFDEAYAIIIDRSFSMTGYKMILAALVAAVIARLNPFGNFVVSAFNTNVDFIKRLKERKAIEEIVGEILNLSPVGYTDISRALEENFLELDSQGVKRKVGILITDGEWTAGENPLNKVTLYDRLHVICVPSRLLSFSRLLANYGGGKFVLIRNVREIPDELPTILMDL
ncbi:MAG: hypothetical protein B6U69_01720 [Thermofilum sp. ex4484_15]|nr:MAG: hypothetical protein B6U69_01720 [Thermofilum sp. ex4484_15]